MTNNHMCECEDCFEAQKEQEAYQRGWNDARAKAAIIALNFNPNSIIAESIRRLQPDGKEGI